MLNINSSLVNDLRQEEYRDAYAAAQIKIVLPFHVRALRIQRGWSQAELAHRAGMTQPRIAEIEKPGARRLNIETLLRIAIAFDIGLQIRFMPFSELVEWAERFVPDTFSVPSFDDEISILDKDPEITQPTIVANDFTGIEREIDMPQNQLCEQIASPTPKITSIEAKARPLGEYQRNARPIVPFTFTDMTREEQKKLADNHATITFPKQETGYARAAS